jgi:hypothetical protein
MNAPEDRADAAEARSEKTEREREPAPVEGRDEKPAVEPFDPYFGRTTGERFPWV